MEKKKILIETDNVNEIYKKYKKYKTFIYKNSYIMEKIKK